MPSDVLDVYDLLGINWTSWTLKNMKSQARILVKFTLEERLELGKIFSNHFIGAR